MHFITAATTAALLAQASAKVVSVTVAQNGLSFTPNNIKADKGDTLEFRFFPSSHSVIQGDGSKACNPASGGFYSGIVRSTGGMNPQVFRVPVTSTDTMYLYCGVSTHCNDGMVAVVNGKTDKDVADYAAAAGSASNIGVPSGGASGGMFADANSPVPGGEPSMAPSMQPSMMPSSMPQSMPNSMPNSMPMSSMMTNNPGMTNTAGSMAPTNAMTSNTGTMPTTVPTAAAASVQVQLGRALAAIAGVAAFLL